MKLLCNIVFPDESGALDATERGVFDICSAEYLVEIHLVMFGLANEIVMLTMENVDEEKAMGYLRTLFSADRLDLLSEAPLVYRTNEDADGWVPCDGNCDSCSFGDICGELDASLAAEAGARQKNKRKADKAGKGSGIIPIPRPEK